MVVCPRNLARKNSYLSLILLKIKVMPSIDLQAVRQGNIRAIARAVSLLENNAADNARDLDRDPIKPVPIIGITGPPGAGKSTLVDKLIGTIISNGAKVAILCVDPSSPLHNGSLLGDRIRMSSWYSNPNVFIRSLSSRGAIGGLHPYVLEICHLLSHAAFDYIIIETVGVGQNEVSIVSLADISILVLVPESGDDIQAIKSGIMEIANVFVVNKSDRPDAQKFITVLKSAQQYNGDHKKPVPIISTIATTGEGIDVLFNAVQQMLQDGIQKNPQLLADRAYAMIARSRMKDINRVFLRDEIKKLLAAEKFNLRAFVDGFIGP